MGNPQQASPIAALRVGTAIANYIGTARQRGIPVIQSRSNKCMDVSCASA